MKPFPITIILLLIISSLSQCTDQDNPLPAETKKEKPVVNKTEYQLKLGETFTIELYENGSIGFSNCWTNQYNCNSIELKERKYVSSQKEKDGYIGAGGSTFWTFEATSVGVDTVLIEWCPTGIQRKSCTYYSSDSLSFEVDSIQRRFNTHRSASIIVNVLN